MYLIAAAIGGLYAAAIIWRRLSIKKSNTLLIVLGSGGHTTEILKILYLPKSSNSEKREIFDLNRIYVMASTDKNSEYKAECFEEMLSKLSPSFSSKTRANLRHPKLEPGDYEIIRIPRSRHVHQSWISTPFTTLYSFLFSLVVIWKINPNLLVANGPGTCVPLCLSAWIFSKLQLSRCKILFVESFARVKKLSMTGRILYYFADRFVVHWPNLIKKYPRAEYTGKLL